MTGTGTALLLLAAAAPMPAAPHHVTTTARITLRERIVLRVPARRIAPVAIRGWREKKGPACMTLAAIGGAAVVDATTVDFILDGGTRLRARFERGCPALDFYAGFYLAPSGDGRICAGRDEVHDRSGSACGIDRFRLLLINPALPPQKPMTIPKARHDPPRRRED